MGRGEDPEIYEPFTATEEVALFDLHGRPRADSLVRLADGVIAVAAVSWGEPKGPSLSSRLLLGRELEIARYATQNGTFEDHVDAASGNERGPFRILQAHAGHS